MKQTECMIPTYGELTKQQIAFINNNSHVIRHRKGEIIFRQDHPVTHLIYIKSGLLKFYKEVDENRKIILDILPAGQFIGLVSIFYKNLYPYSTSSVEGGELIYTSSHAIRDLVAENGKYASHFLVALSSRMVTMMDRMITYTKKQVPGRIAELLLNFSKNIYNNNAFTLPLSRTEIADYVQTTKETVSRTLTEFKNDRIIELDDKNIVLKSLDLLEILNKIG